MKYSKSQFENWKGQDRSLVNPEDLEKSRDMDMSTEERKALMDSIREQMTVTLDDAKKAELEAFYESKKPELKEGDEYQLIAMDITERGDVYTGILNCRVNGDHKQIRF